MQSPLRRSILSGAQNYTQEGAIETEMKARSLKPIPNDGVHIYSNVKQMPTTSAPFSDSHEITISLASSNHAKFINPCSTVIDFILSVSSQPRNNIFCPVGVYVICNGLIVHFQKSLTPKVFIAHFNCS